MYSTKAFAVLIACCMLVIKCVSGRGSNQTCGDFFGPADQDNFGGLQPSQSLAFLSFITFHIALRTGTDFRLKSLWVAPFPLQQPVCKNSGGFVYTCPKQDAIKPVPVRLENCVPYIDINSLTVVDTTSAPVAVLCDTFKTHYGSQFAYTSAYLSTLNDPK